MIAVVVSRADGASVHIGARLLDLADWTEHEDDGRPDAAGGGTYYRREGFELREFEELHLHLEGVAEAFTDPDLIVFVSRHAGETGRLLTAHTTGNVGPAEYGGADGELARAAPNALDRILDGLGKRAPEGYDVGMECTHHGPSSVGAPSLFVEVGSAEPQWRDAEAAEAVAAAVLDLAGTPPDAERTVVGIGGGHYAPRFTRISRETDWAVGHVLADWGLEAMFEAGIDPARVIEQAFEQSEGTRAAIDGDWPEVEATVEGLGYRVVSETWVRETTGVPLDLVARLEAELGAVDAGLRFGEPARAGTSIDSFHTVAPDADLLADLHGIDAARAREAVAAHAIAFGTEENGNRVSGPIAVPDGEAYDDLIAALADLLADRFESVERTPEGLVVTERAFDPERARTLGIEEGPAYGRLANGEAVEIGGREIEPAAVHETRRHTYDLSAPET